MSEVEFDLLLDAVKTAIAPVPEEDFLSQPSPLTLRSTGRRAPPTTTGRPGLWFRFLRGWYAAC